MNPRTDNIVDQVLASFVILYFLALALVLCAGCAVIPPGHPVAAYSLINFAPSVKLQIGGSDARVDVNNEQSGEGHTITKETPIDARVEAATSLEAQGIP